MSASDIKQDKARLEQELRIQRQKTFVSGLFQGDGTVHALLELLAEGVVIIDNGGIILLVNTAAEQMFGYQRQDLIGSHFSCFYPEEEQNAGKPEEKLIKASAEERFEHESWLIRKNGSRFWADVTMTALFDECGILRGFSTVAHDITGRKMTEEALRESEYKFSKAFHVTPSVLVISSLANGRYKEVNEAFERVIGYRRDEVIGRSSLQLNIWQNPEERDMVLRMLAKGEKIRDMEIGFRNKSGAIIVGLYSAEIIEIGEEQCLLSLVSDITARKKAEEELRRSEERYRSLYNETPVMLHSIDHDGRLVSVSNYWLETLGYERSEVLGRSSTEFLTVPSRSFATKIVLPEFFRTGSCMNVPYQIVKKNGEILDVLLSAIVERDSEEKVVRSLAVMVDVTERKRSEEALLMRTSELEAIFQAFPDIYFWVDNEERIIDYKAGATEELYTPPEAFLGKRMQDVLPPDVGEQMHVAVQQVLTTGAPTSLEYWLPVRDGKLAFEARLQPLPGNQTFFVVRNITTRKWSEEEIKRLNTNLAARAADLEDANLELEAFNYTVAHDLRQPLNIVGINCQAIDMLYGDQLQEECRLYVRDAYNGTLRMNQLIEDLLDFSRMAHVELRRDVIDLSGVAQEVAAELTQAEPARRVALRIKEGIMASGDSSLLRLVLVNLIGNTWKYTGTRDEAIIEFGTTEVNGKPAYFVRDNGAGFDMANADKLFVPFKRLPSAEEYKCRGLGIGLATVERIIRRHGGRVWAEGAPEEGACFYFTLSAD